MTPCKGCPHAAKCKKAGKCMKKNLPKRGQRAATNKAREIIMKKMDMQTELTHYQHMFLDQLEERLECPEKTYSKEGLAEKIQQTYADIDRNLGFS